MSRILITGATGTIGNILLPALGQQGHPITIVSRRSSPPSHLARWIQDVILAPTLSEPFPVDFPSDLDIVIHLAGESVAGLWTPWKKKAIVESRLLSTQKLVAAISRLARKPSLFLCASAVGFYGPRDPDEILEETAPQGAGFLAETCAAWEREASRLTGVRTHSLRFGIVLARQGGFLGKLSPIFRLGLGAILGSGQQRVSWIHERDLADAFLFLLRKNINSGPLNMSTPFPTDNESLSRLLAHRFGRGLLPPAPEWLLKLTGDFGRELLLGGQNVFPRSLLDAGFSFRFPNLDPALADLIPAKG